MLAPKKKIEVKRTYELRSRNTSLEPVEEYVSTGGLAPNPPQKTKMGRKSFLSKAQRQALVDVNLGKQSTLKRELRVLAPEEGPGC